MSIMDRRKKINLIKQVAAGKMEALEELKRERANKDFFNESFIPIFYFLIEKGRLVNDRDFEKEPEISEADKNVFREDCNRLELDQNYQNVSDRFLIIVLEICKTYEYLRDNNQLDLLKDYKNYQSI